MAAMAAGDDANRMDTAVPTNEASASQSSDANAVETDPGDDDYCFRLPSGDSIFKGQSVREPKPGSFLGPKLLVSRNPEAEAAQLQALAKERAQALGYVGSYKLADVAEATWHEQKIVLTRHKASCGLSGHFLSFMGRAAGRRTLLHPLETLFLVESGQLTLKRDGVPVSLPEAYELLLEDGDDLDQYRVYAHLVRAGYVVLLRRRCGPLHVDGWHSSDDDDDDDDDDVVCLEDDNDDSDVDVVQVIPAKQAKMDAPAPDSPTSDPAEASQGSDRPRPNQGALDFPVLVAGRPIILQRPPRHLLPPRVSPCRDWYHLDPRHWEGPPRDPWGPPQVVPQGPWPRRGNQHRNRPPRQSWEPQPDRQIWGDWRGGERWERRGRGWHRVPRHDARNWGPPGGGPPPQRGGRLPSSSYVRRRSALSWSKRVSRPPLEKGWAGLGGRRDGGSGMVYSEREELGVGKGRVPIDRQTNRPTKSTPWHPRRGSWRDNGQATPQRPYRGHRPSPQDDGYPSALPRLPPGAARSWSQLKGGLAGAQRTRALLGGEGALLWKGPIKPLVLPSRDLSLGGIVSQLSLVQEVDLTETCKHLRVPPERVLEVYLTAVGFRKTSPGLPEYRVAMVRWEEGIPKLADLVRSSLGDGVPLVFAGVDTSGQVQLFALEPLVAPNFAPGP
ncbi:unnamed protein product [Ixodes hexagonus]